MSQILESWFILPGVICFRIISYFNNSLRTNDEIKSIYIKAMTLVSYTSCFLGMTLTHYNSIIKIASVGFLFGNKIIESKFITTTNMNSVATGFANLILVLMMLAIFFALLSLIYSVVISLLTGLTLKLIRSQSLSLSYQHAGIIIFFAMFSLTFIYVTMSIH